MRGGRKLWRAFGGTRLPRSPLVLAGVVGTLVVTMSTLGAPGIELTASSTVTEYPLPTANADPAALTAGPNGAVWVSEGTAFKIAEVASDGTTTEFPLPQQDLSVQGITEGSDGNLWSAEGGASRSFCGGQLLQMTPAGAVTTFALPGGYIPQSMALGPDGNVWFVAAPCSGSTSAIGQVTPTGSVTLFPLPSTTIAFDVAAGPDGNLWVARQGHIDKVTTQGAVTEYPVGSSSNVSEVAAGPDGNVWFTEIGSDEIGSITPAGSVTTYYEAGGPSGITPGPNDSLIVTFVRSPAVEQIDLSGNEIQGEPLSQPSDPQMVVAGPDGNYWFADTIANAVGKFVVGTSGYPRQSTTTTLTAAQSTVPYGWGTTLTAVVAPTDGQGAVAFSEDGHPIPGCGEVPLVRSGSSYEAQCGVDTSEPPGSYPVTAAFSGTVLYEPSSATITETVTQAQTTLTVYPIDVADSVLNHVTVAAQLTAGPSDYPTRIAGQPVAFSFADGTPICSATTDSNGVAVCSGGNGAISKLLSNSRYDGIFAGSTDYSASQGSAPITLVNTGGLLPAPVQDAIGCVQSALSTLLYATPPDPDCQGLGIIGL